MTNVTPACFSLSGTLPFYADNPDDFLELVLSSSFSFPDSEWAEVSTEGAYAKVVCRPELSSAIWHFSSRFECFECLFQPKI